MCNINKLQHIILQYYDINVYIYAYSENGIKFLNIYKLWGSPIVNYFY